MLDTVSGQDIGEVPEFDPKAARENLTLMAFGLRRILSAASLGDRFGGRIGRCSDPARWRPMNSRCGPWMGWG